MAANPEITVYATNKNFLNVYDCLEIGKVKIEVASYDPKTHRQTARAYAYVDVAKVRLIIHAVKAGRFGKLLRGKFEDFGGSQVDGELQSRIFTLEYDPGEDNRFARFPIRLTIANGPGKRNRQGGVMPDGQPTQRVSMRFPMADFVRILLEVEAYIDAWFFSNFQRIRQERVQALTRRLEGRQQEGGNGNGNGSKPEGGNGNGHLSREEALATVLFFAPKDDPRLRGKTLSEVLSAGREDLLVTLADWKASSERGKRLAAAAKVLVG